MLSAIASPGLGQLYNGRLGKSWSSCSACPSCTPRSCWPRSARGPPCRGCSSLRAHLAGWADGPGRVPRRARLGGAPRPCSALVRADRVGLPTVSCSCPFGRSRCFGPVQAFMLPTGSMEQTLLVGDHVSWTRPPTASGCPSVTPSLMPRPPRAATSRSSCIRRTRASTSSCASSACRARPSRSGGAGSTSTGACWSSRTSSFSRPPTDPYAGELGSRGRAARPVLRAGRQPRQQQGQPLLRLPSRRDLVGRVAFVYLSIAPSRGGGRIRWDRIGHVPR